MTGLEIGDTVLSDIDRTIALWVEAGTDATTAWLELTGKKRRYTSWTEVKGLMLGLERRRAAAAAQQVREEHDA